MHQEESYLLLKPGNALIKSHSTLEWPREACRSHNVKTTADVVCLKIRVLKWDIARRNKSLKADTLKLTLR